MRWFRRYRICGAQAALLALALQFVLAFGHVHAIETADDTVGVAAANTTSSPATPESGGSHKDNGLCACCVTLHLTGTAQAAAAPTLAMPADYTARAFSFASDAALDEWPLLEQRSRGPPQA
jgi:Protein of unknown function (DUF2946)